MSLRLHLSVPCVRSFSTTASAFAVKGAKQKQSYKNKNSSGKKRRGPGSNKYFLDAVSHSNLHKKADAAVLEDLGKLTISEDGTLAFGSLVRYPSHILKTLYRFGSFQKTQFNEIHPEPLSVIRESTTGKLWDFLNSSVETSSKSNRLIITGDSGVGKSTAIAQFQALSKTKGSVVIPFTNLDSLLDGSSDFVFDQTSQKYSQPMANAKLLKKVRTGNEEELKEIKLENQDLSAWKTGDVTPETSLYEFLQLARSQKLKWNSGAVLEFAVKVLSEQVKYPVYLTVDNLSAFPKTPFTAYRNTSNEPLYFGDFQLASLITDLASGFRSFKKGGVVMATSGIHGEFDQTIPAVCGLVKPDPYSTQFQFDDVFAKKLVSNGGVKHLAVENLTLEESEVLVNFLVDSQVIPEEDGDLTRLAQAKYFLSGNGNPLALYKSCVLAYM
ncbi:unnamed protein product [Kuraishia capsulata CBS 1993]|uniref:Small ribosomal subunit protein mS29 n=1 Tax=Kuraishia capsulata CBS 1993 TaxID=1382522 RepID=W6MN41_9ASCO|nr:uncharacterized protein KUCA_T00002424001 [Kuraishia capsulata CBS 1993]CDK26452.1 unnamed protein product [Kuraishia capsulata CBS 1993]